MASSPTPEGAARPETEGVRVIVKRCDSCGEKVEPGERDYVIMYIDPHWSLPGYAMEGCRGELTLCKLCFDGINLRNPRVVVNRPESGASGEERGE